MTHSQYFIECRSEHFRECLKIRQNRQSICTHNVGKKKKIGTLLNSLIRKQECIPVGCVPPAAVAICWGCLPRCMLRYTPRSVGLEPPQCGPGPPGCGLPPPHRCGPGQAPQHPPGSGPRHPPRPDPQHPPGSGPRHPPRPDPQHPPRVWNYTPPDEQNS